jgi:hypothetical protein
MGFDKILNWMKKHHNLVLICVLALAFIIRLKIFLATKNIAIWWDEGDYAFTGKNWGLELGVRDLWYYRRTFLLPLLFGNVFALGGSEVTLRLIIMLMSVAVVYMTYLIGKELFNKHVGLIAALGISASRIHLFLTGRILNEIPATLFILLGYYFFIKGYMKKEDKWFVYLSAVFITFGMMTRFATLLSLIPILFYIFFKEGVKALKNKNLWIFALIVIILMLPFLYLYNMHFSSGVVDFYKHYAGLRVKEETGEDILMGLPGIGVYFLNLIPNMHWIFFIAFLFGAVMFLDIFLGYDLLFKDGKIKKKVFLLLWIIIPIIVHGMISEYLQERYLSWSYPAFFILAGIGFMKVYDGLKKYREVLAVVIVVLLLITGAVFSMKAGAEVIKVKADTYRQVKDSGEWLKDHTQIWDGIISQSRPQHAYYSERSVWSTTNFADEKEFNDYIERIRPKYYVLSLYEPTNPEWGITYGQRHQLNPEVAWFFDAEKKQPSIIIYRMDDSFWNRLKNAA